MAGCEPLRGPAASPGVCSRTPSAGTESETASGPSTVGRSFTAAGGGARLETHSCLSRHSAPFGQYPF